MKKLLLLFAIALSVQGCDRYRCSECDVTSIHGASATYILCGKDRHEEIQAMKDDFDPDVTTVNCRNR